MHDQFASSSIQCQRWDMSLRFFGLLRNMSQVRSHVHVFRNKSCLGLDGIPSGCRGTKSWMWPMRFCCGASRTKIRDADPTDTVPRGDVANFGPKGNLAEKKHMGDKMWHFAPRVFVSVKAPPFGQAVSCRAGGAPEIAIPGVFARSRLRGSASPQQHSLVRHWRSRCVAAANSL